MNILLIGSGGREHALGWKISQSPQCSKLFMAPGNGGVSEFAERIQLDLVDHQAVLSFCRLMAINFVIIGPEAPLVDGLTDTLSEAGILVFGPSAAAAQLEGSKHFTKTLCDRMNVPTASFGHFTDAESARDHVNREGVPIVIKADGLAAGKGVTIAETLGEANAAINACFEGAFGGAGSEVVIEEFLIGEEASMFYLCHGEDAIAFGTAQDHKRVGDGDTGPNTGGMGAYSPAPVVSEAVSDQVLNTIILPSLRGLVEAGTPFSGVLFAGLMIGDEGPKLIEYNVRFGDPECQVLMMRLQTDLLDILLACAEGRLGEAKVTWSDGTALTVVMAAAGYPGSYKKGSQINGLEGLGDDLIHVFHAGTERVDNLIQATGGRVLNVTALGNSVLDAQTHAYNAIAKIDWPEGFCRQDIGWRAIAREQN